MNIVFLVSSMHAGGAERVAATLCGGWVQRGDTVTLVPTYTGKGQLFYELDPRIRLEWLADKLDGALARGPLAPLVKLKALREVVQQHRPDVVVSFLTNVNVMAIMATLGMKVPLIVCERTNPGVSTSASRALRYLRRWLYPQAAMVTVQAQASVDPMRTLVPNIKRLAVVPNPLPPGLPTANAVAEPTRVRRRLVAMGRLVPSKRFSELVRVFARLVPRFSDWDLVVWGEGPMRSSLEAEVAAANLSDRVKFPGRTSQPWAELQASDLFVLTSEIEGFPNALIEAMALGLPCVAVDCPSGPKEITRDGSDAILVPLYDDARLEQALASLMGSASERLRLGAAGAASVRERYGLAHVLAHWDTLFAQIGAKRSQEANGA